MIKNASKNRFDSFVLVRMVLILHQSGASHGHSHRFPTGRLQREDERQSHCHTHAHANASVKAAFIHVVGDLLQSVGVLLAASIIHFWVSVSKNTKGMSKAKLYCYVANKILPPAPLTLLSLSGSFILISGPSSVDSVYTDTNKWP